MKETVWNRSEKVDHLAYVLMCTAGFWNHQNDKKLGPVLVTLQALYTERITWDNPNTKIFPDFYDVTCYISNMKAFEEPMLFMEHFFSDVLPHLHNKNDIAHK